MKEAISSASKRRVVRGVGAVVLGTVLALAADKVVNGQVDNSSMHGVTSEAPVDVFPRK